MVAYSEVRLKGTSGSRVLQHPSCQHCSGLLVSIPLLVSFFISHVSWFQGITLSHRILSPWVWRNSRNCWPVLGNQPFGKLFPGFDATCPSSWLCNSSFRNYELTTPSPLGLFNTGEGSVLEHRTLSSPRPDTRYSILLSKPKLQIGTPNVHPKFLKASKAYGPNQRSLHVPWHKGTQGMCAQEAQRQHYFPANSLWWREVTPTYMCDLGSGIISGSGYASSV